MPFPSPESRLCQLCQRDGHCRLTTEVVITGSTIISAIRAQEDVITIPANEVVTLPSTTRRDLPIEKSSPSPPLRSSLPAPPLKKSSPSPPLRRSLPSPPSSSSMPAPSRVPQPRHRVRRCQPCQRARRCQLPRPSLPALPSMKSLLGCYQGIIAVISNSVRHSYTFSQT